MIWPLGTAMGWHAWNQHNVKTIHKPFILSFFFGRAKEKKPCVNYAINFDHCVLYG